MGFYLEANVPEVTVEVAPEVLELNEDLKKGSSNFLSSYS